MRRFAAVLASALLGALPGAGSAAEEADAGAFRVDLRGGVGIRSDTVTVEGGRIGARGTALSDLVLGGAWFPGGGRLGMAGRGELSRFALKGDLGAVGQASLPATGIEASLALAGRLRLPSGGGRWQLEGQLGYGFLQIPLARGLGAGGEAPDRADNLRAHGPVAGILVAFAPADAVTLDVTGRAFPVTFGGRYRDAALGPRRLAAGAGASLGRLLVGDFRLAGVVGYEVAGTSADEGGVSVRQVRHQILVGVRATPRGARSAARPAGSGELVQAGPPRGRIRGLVRLATGEPLAGVGVKAADGPATRTAADGSFALAEVAPGLIKLELSGADLVPATEVVSVPPGGEVTVQIGLRRAQAPAPATLIGLVRSESGTPVAARVRLLEPGLSVEADARGHFQFEVPAGRYTLTIEAPGFVTQRKSVRAGAGEQNIYNVDLQAER